MANTCFEHLLAESFAEHMFGNCNIVLTSGNMSLNPIEMGQLVVLRINNCFIQYTKKIHRCEMATALGMGCTIIGDVEVVDAVDADDVNPADFALVPVIYY